MKIGVPDLKKNRGPGGFPGNQKTTLDIRHWHERTHTPLLSLKDFYSTNCITDTVDPPCMTSVER